MYELGGLTKAVKHNVEPIVTLQYELQETHRGSALDNYLQNDTVFVQVIPQDADAYTRRYDQKL